MGWVVSVRSGSCVVFVVELLASVNVTIRCGVVLDGCVVVFGFGACVVSFVVFIVDCVVKVVSFVMFVAAGNDVLIGTEVGVVVVVVDKVVVVVVGSILSSVGGGLIVVVAAVFSPEKDMNIYRLRAYGTCG